MTATAAPLFLFAPGAGAPSTSAWMRAWRDRLATLGDVVMFDYPYMKAGRRMPDRAPVLIAAHADALAQARRAHPGAERVFLIGKSMGSRIGCHLALETPVSGVICLGYPLISASSGAKRDQVLLALRTPILFVQGTKDEMCPLAELEALRTEMPAPTTLFVVTGGDHSLELSRATSQRAAGEASNAAVLAAIQDFVTDLA
jgi:predicted alpha/beta-hydrolase family hydrolase